MNEVLFSGHSLTVCAVGQEEVVRIQLERSVCELQVLEIQKTLGLAGKGKHVESESARTIWIAPNEWVLKSKLRKDYALAEDVEKVVEGVCHSVTVISDSRFTFSIEGYSAEDFLSACCSLNLLVNNFPSGSSTVTRFLGQSALLSRIKNTEFEVMIDSSFTQYVSDKLLSISEEFRVICDDATY